MTEPATPRQFWTDTLAIAIGTLITLVVSGYQFGRGNHTVYLLEGLRITDPSLFRNDWFVTSTLQYHAMFSWIAAMLTKLNVLEAGFLSGYLLLAIAWHIAWQRITRRLGGNRLTYLFSVVLFYLSGAGIALGAYQFLQDGCFLPSNVSTIAMLWGCYFWAIDRRIAAGIALGIAGAFHLNFAVMAVGMWGLLAMWEAIDSRRVRSMFTTSMLIGSLFLLIPSLINIVHSLQVKLRESGSIPLDQFVDIYVRFRHTHHFNPLGWPVALWASFLWPIPLAIYAWRARRETRDHALVSIARIVIVLLALNCISLVFAGVWFVSESLVQLMFWRFSIYIKLFTCIGAAFVLLNVRARGAILWIIPLTLAACVFAGVQIEQREHPRWMDIALNALRAHLPAFILFVALTFVPAIMHALRRIQPRTPAPFIAGTLACILLTVIGWNRWLGWGMTPEAVDPEYLELCHWAREATPVDAIFLVPPSDTAFRLEAQRAIVVNFKHVPQLSGELTHWLDRMTDLLGTRDLTTFPRDYMKLLPALDAQYESRSPAELIDVARKYDARYIVIARDWGDAFRAQQVYRSDARRVFVYDVAR